MGIKDRPSSSLASQLSASASLAPDLRRSVTSITFALCCALGAVLSLACFHVLGQAIVAGAQSAGFTGDVSDLQILDVRNGYTVTQVNMLMAAWGLRGRLLYLLIELIDVTVYCTCYRGLFVVTINRLGGAVGRRWPGAKPGLLWLAAGPVLLAGLDLVEDASQVTLTLAYSWTEASGHAPPQGAWWAALVNVACTLNKVKWGFVRTLLVPFFALVVAQLVALAAPQRRESKRSE